VTVGDTSEHRLEAEDTVLPAKTVARLRVAQAEGRRVVAVGTTVTRALEAWVRMPESDGSRDVQFSTDLFITPGFDFRVVCALLTNFHLPRSTLLMLVCAFGGRENVLAAYEEAIRQGYLFYSYGDAMFVSESSSIRIARV
jgi:S-adenosylmethionine:tRNA ribosyltransferase-isomerase